MPELERQFVLLPRRRAKFAREASADRVVWYAIYCVQNWLEGTASAGVC